MTNVHDWTQPPVKKRKKSKLLIVVLVALGVFALIMCGLGSYMILSAPSHVRATVQDPYSPSATPTAKAPPSPKGYAKPSVKDGEWTAGEDFPVGTYATTTQADNCVWQVTTGQGESVHYVDPGHVGPGHYKFTFKTGETLHTVNCGTWVKQ